MSDPGEMFRAAADDAVRESWADLCAALDAVTLPDAAAVAAAMLARPTRVLCVGLRWIGRGYDEPLGAADALEWFVKHLPAEMVDTVRRTHAAAEIRFRNGSRCDFHSAVNPGAWFGTRYDAAWLTGPREAYPEAALWDIASRCRRDHGND